MSLEACVWVVWNFVVFRFLERPSRKAACFDFDNQLRGHSNALMHMVLGEDWPLVSK